MVESSYIFCDPKKHNTFCNQLSDEDYHAYHISYKIRTRYLRNYKIPRDVMHVVDGVGDTSNGERWIGIGKMHIGVFRFELLEGVKESSRKDWERGKFEFIRELKKYELTQIILEGRRGPSSPGPV